MENLNSPRLRRCYYAVVVVRCTFYSKVISYYDIVFLNLHMNCLLLLSNFVGLAAVEMNHRSLKAEHNDSRLPKEYV